MSQYKLSQDELAVFIRKIYEEACYGYMDLKDSVCDRMLRDFLDGREIVPAIDTRIMAMPEGYSLPGRHSVTIGNTTYNGDGIVITSSSGNYARLSDVDQVREDVVLRDDNLPLRDENYVRTEFNYEGNESERH